MASIPSGINVMWPSTNGSIPTGWDRNTDFDDKFIKGTAAGVNPGVNGGAATHTHTASAHTHSTVAAHTHSGSSGGGSTGSGPSGTEFSHWRNKNHSHSLSLPSATASGPGGGTSNWSSQSNNPTFYRVIFIESDGSESGYPNDCLVFFNSATAPDNWTQHSSSVGRFFYGATANGNGGATGGGGSHNHPTSGTHLHSGNISNHNHGYSGNSGNASGATVTSNQGGGYTPGVEYQYHYHTPTAANDGASAVTAQSGATSGNDTYEPSYQKLHAIENNSGANQYTEGAIVLWDGLLSAIPDDFLLCDGTNDTPDMRGVFPKNTASGSSDLNATGGTAGHTHSAGAGHLHVATHSHTVTLPGNSTTSNSSHYPGNTDGHIVHNGHTHTASLSGSANTSSATEPISSSADSQPAFRTVAYLLTPEVVSGNALFFAGNF